MIDLKFKIEEAPDAKSFMVIATEQIPVAISDLVLEMTIEDDVQPHIVDIPLPVGFGHSVMVATITLNDMPFEAERFEDGVYWFKVKTATDATDVFGAGFLAILVNLVRLQNLNLDHRNHSFVEVEDAHFRWMILQCAIWATEVGQTKLFKQHIDYLKKLLPYMEEINEDYQNKEYVYAG